MADFYRVVRIRPNGTEVVLRDILYADVTAEQTIRAESFADAETRKATGVHVRVYSSSNETVSPGDLIWDSEL